MPCRFCYAIDTSVVSLKRAWLVRLICGLLLTWTAVDLSASSVCLLDRGKSVALASHIGPLLDDSATQAPAPAAHMDDCFCCSHCVNVSDATTPVLPEPAPTPCAPPAINRPVDSPDSTYRPPEHAR